MENSKFENLVSTRVTEGWRLESKTDSDAVLVKGRKVNHMLHLLLSVFTFGLWAIVWVSVASWAGERRTTLRLYDNDVVQETTQRPGAFKTWPPICKNL